MPQIHLEVGPFGTFVITNLDNEKQTRFVQTDWDYPGVACSFGWSTRDVQLDNRNCDHAETDGTVDCKLCGVTASQFIAAASEYLTNHDGAVVDDPGYFSE